MGIFSKSRLDVRSQLGFTVLYKEYGNHVFQICYRYLQNKDISHNITAEIFTSIWERRDILHQKALSKDSWKRYLSQAAKNHVIDYLRVKKQLDIYFSRTSYKIRTYSKLYRGRG